MNNLKNKFVYEVKDLTKSYEAGNNQGVIKNLDFFVKPKDFIAITGPSGVGKSTLLNLLGLLDVPTEGVIKFLGKFVSNLNEEKRSKIRREKIGFIFQFHHLFDELTSLENIMVPLLLQGKSKEEAKEETIEILKDLSILDKKNVKPKKLSGGEKQRVAIGRAIIHQPAVILGDEISGNLDTETSVRILQLLRSIRKKYSTTLIIATHDMLVAREADIILELKNGVLERREI